MRPSEHFISSFLTRVFSAEIWFVLLCFVVAIGIIYVPSGSFALVFDGEFPHFIASCQSTMGICSILG